MKCPRCGARLRFHECNAVWLAWFECEECLGAFSLVCEPYGKKHYTLRLEQRREKRAVDALRN